MLVSIAMATYNGEKYIREQLDSIIAQSYNNIEIIIVDDCSTDNTPNIIKNYSDNRITLIEGKKNIGCTATFEKAIKLCQGEYIALCDQDDIWHKNKIEILLRAIQGKSLVYSDYEFIDKNSQKSYGSASYINRLHGLDDRVNKIELYTYFNSFILGCSVMFDRDLLSRILPIYNNGFNHDKWIVFQAALSRGINYVDEVLFSYRIHENNLSLKSTKDQKKSKKRKTIYYPAKIIEISVRDNLRFHNLYKISKAIDKGFIGRFLTAILYYKYIAARYYHFTKLKQIVKFVYAGKA